MSAAFSHIAVSVAHLRRSTAFYTEVFGFRPGQPYASAGRRVAALMESDPAGFEAVFLRLGDLLLELIEYADPVHRAEVPRPAAELGVAHLSFVVENLGEVISRAESAGGEIRTLLAYEFGSGPATEIAFCTDPDGNRLELIQHAAPDEVRSHSGFLGLTDLGWPAVGA